MNWQIWFSLAVIAVAVVAIVKRYETRLVLLLAGFLMCIVAGDPMKGFQAFIKGMTSITLVPAICAAMGFAAVVTASKCDEHLVAAVASPIKALGAWLIPITTLLTFGINIAIMSAAGTAATAGATFIPLLLRAKIRPAAAAAAVGGGTMCGLLLNPGCAHDIYVAKMADVSVMSFIGWAAPYILVLVLVATVINAALSIFLHRDYGVENSALVDSEDRSSFKINYLKAIAPLIPLFILLVSTVCFPEAGIDVVAAMLIGMVLIGLITLINPGELSKAFFKGMGQGYAQVIGLIVAAGVFSAGLQATGAISAFIETLKTSNDLARWGAGMGPLAMALGTGSGEAAIWAFNQAVTPQAASFGMDSQALGLLAILAGQFGRTASPLAGAIIIVAGMASADPMQVAKRLFPGMLVAALLATLWVV